MSERYYVVSESELKELAAKAVANYRISTSTASYTDPEGAERRLNEAEAACRARPVPEWATHFAGPPKDWTNYSVDDETVPVTLLEEIRR